MHLFCERCQNIVGETGTDADGVEFTRISIKIRGQRRRSYVVVAISSVTCDYCGHTGKPLPGVLNACGRRADR